MKRNNILKAGCFLFLFSFLVNLSVEGQKRDVYMGGRVAMTLPTNIGKDSELPMGFKDMSTTGIEAAYFGRWFYMKRLSLGWDLAYQFQSIDEDFWNVENRGEVTGNYQTIQLLVEGNYYFSSDEIRPYLGITTGAFALFNQRTYSSSNEAANASNTYKYQKVMPGLAPQAGILFEIGSNTFLDIHARLVLMPNLDEEYVYDENIGEISTNPHGAQNHLSLSIGLLF
ncbi:hypothetical protein [Carboxylicivirga linearis]|uniref:Outer membrane protein beta-barrel domain-containing protein n=1 Tax=Carboxylicivirga linearis TaxID=1628157 RepID=A0ABS5JU83_9BACT|nr:hypothetical protein [Carboxylicivirga linearis]MBS2098360.1 hypothetical protein [Carboxylicivirga linearis]